MTAKIIKVGIESDAIEKLSKVSADQALEELIWNRRFRKVEDLKKNRKDFE